MRYLLFATIAIAPLAITQTQIAYRFDGVQITRLITVKTDDGAQEVTMTATLYERVTPLPDGSGLVRERVLRGITTTVGEAREVSMESLLPFATMDSAGRILSQFGEGADAESLLQARLLAIVLPTDPIVEGSTWRHIEPASEGVDQIESVYVLVGQEKIDGRPCAKVAWTSTVPGEAIGTNGTAWLALDTGQILKLEANIDSLPVAGKPVKATIKITPVG